MSVSSSSSAPAYSHFGTLPSRDCDAFQTCMGFSTLPELQRASRVSRAWQHYIAPNPVWKKACLTNQFPLVVGGARNIQKDVRVLYPRTVSGKSLSETIGRPVEKKDGKIVAAKALILKVFLTKRIPVHPKIRHVTCGEKWY